MDIDTADPQQLETSPVADDHSDQPPGPPQELPDTEEFPCTEEATTRIPSTDRAAERAAVASSPQRRALKLVVTVGPAQGGEARAVLALGTDGCDPVLRVTEATDLAGALQLVPEFLAEAEARWQVQSRYPSGVPSGSTSAGSRAARPAGPRVPAPSESAESEATSDSDARAQLDLFA